MTLGSLLVCVSDLDVLQLFYCVHQGPAENIVGLCWQLLKELEGRPATAASFGLEPSALPSLVEHNPSIAVEVRAFLHFHVLRPHCVPHISTLFVFYHSESVEFMLIANQHNVSTDIAAQNLHCKDDNPKWLLSLPPSPAVLLSEDCASSAC